MKKTFVFTTLCPIAAVVALFFATFFGPQISLAQRPVIMSTMPLANQRVVTRFNLGNFERIRQSQYALSCMYMQNCVPECGVESGVVASDAAVTRGQVAPCFPVVNALAGSLWFQNYGDFVTQQARYPGVQGFHTDSYGLNLGYDLLKDAYSVFGVAVGGAFAETEVTKSDQKSDTDSFLVALYGNTSTYHWNVSGSIGYVSADIATDRAAAANGARLLGQHDAETIFGSFEISSNVFMQTLRQSCGMTPFLAYDFIRMTEAAFGEQATTGSASGEALNYGKRRSTSYLQTLGVRYEKAYYEAGGWLVQSSLSIGWLHDYGQRRISTMVLNDNPYQYKGTAMNKNRLAVSLGITASLGNRSSLFARYDGEFNRRYNAQTAQLGFGLGY